MKTRIDSHAGSWYSSDEKKLKDELDFWLSTNKESSSVIPSKNCKAIICPHAGYRFSANTSSFSYNHLNSKKIKLIFILGPSHHVYLEGLSLSSLDSFKTPLGNMKVNQEINNELEKNSNKLCSYKLSKEEEEDEHSIELQLPFIKHIMQDADFSIVPIVVGQFTEKEGKSMGSLFHTYFERDDCLFVISSDFCHWGSRFKFQWQNEELGAIHKSIEWLDREGMRLIETKDVSAFQTYLKTYKNTICGRNPILLLMHTLVHAKEAKVSFIHYEQSGKNTKSSDSSVSYASGVCYI